MRTSTVKFTIVLLILPFFFTINPFGLGPSFLSLHRGNVLPIGILIFILFFFFRFLPIFLSNRSIKFGNRETLNPLLIYIFLVCLSYIFGMLLNAFFNHDVSSILFLQTLLFPIVFLVIRGSIDNFDLNELKGILYIICIAIGIVNSLYLLQTLLGFSPSTGFTRLVDYIGPFFNFKIKRFYPVICSAVFLGLIYFFSKERSQRVRLFYIILMLSSLSVVLSSWGRTSIFSLLVSLFFAFIFFRRFKNYVQNINYSLITITVLGLFFNSFFSELYFGITRFSESFILSITGNLTTGDDIRFDRMNEAFLNGVLRPLGVLFSSEAMSQSPENGYLDIALRCGVFGLIAFSAFLLSFLRGFKLPTEVNDENNIYFFRVIIILFLVSNIFLNIFTEPYLSIFTGIIMAVYSKICDIKNEPVLKHGS